jgi:hypothetical protein
MKLIRNVLNGLALVAGLFLFALVVDRIEPLKQLDAFLRNHAQPYITIALGVLLAGGALLGVAIVSALVGQDGPMSDEEAKEFMGRGSGWQVGVFRGKASGRDARLEASFHDIKEAFRSGAWLRDSGWWPVCFGAIGLILAFLGGFGYFFIVGAPTVKVIVAAVVVYVIVRTSVEFAKA